MDTFYVDVDPESGLIPKHLGSGFRFRIQMRTQTKNKFLKILFFFFSIVMRHSLVRYWQLLKFFFTFKMCHKVLQILKLLILNICFSNTKASFVSERKCWKFSVLVCCLLKMENPGKLTELWNESSLICYSL